ncbi:MAG: cyclase family protein [Calothrix sp. FI2-JRJ7]|jgi:kynurenine formamidase/alkylation response protein AidB-like acyl-CoA dehydrogenase|nr:cyclase family protein [Calothrix sp. FI2-JRJ7]
MNNDLNQIDTIKSFLLTEVQKNANAIDSDSNELFSALRGLGNLDLLALRLPRAWGGKEVEEVEYGIFQELVARYSGALAFLQTQHQSAVGMLVNSSNGELQSKYLPRVSKGEVLLGVGFSQLRREGTPLITAFKVEGGYVLNGVVPWVTGWGVFHEFIVAASLPDGSALFGMAPFEEDGFVSVSAVAPTAAMPSTNTVEVVFSNWFLASESVVFIKPPGWIHEQDKSNVLKSTFLATGCALAGLNIIEVAARKKNLSFITNAYVSLQDELNDCRATIRDALVNKDISFAQKLHLRAWAIELTTRIAHAAVTVSSGAANYKHHNAQRVYREALICTVTGQTRDVMAATLEKLTNVARTNVVQKTHVAQASCLCSDNNIIHLSHVISNNIPQWQGDPPVKFTPAAQIKTHGYFLRELTIGEHSATHINAPISFYKDGTTIDQYPAESLLASAVVIDISTKAQENPDYTLNVSDILDWEELHGEIPHDCVVLLHTAWSAKWHDPSAFMCEDVNGNMHFPGFGTEATKFLLRERQIAGVGIDTHGVDGGLDTTFTINRMVLEKPRIVLENLTNLDKLPVRGFKIVVAPMLLQAGSGSPVGVLAIL